MNNFKVEIYNNKTNLYEDYTKYAVFPFKFANLLDEQLDEANLQLTRVPKGAFQPLTRVRITLVNSPSAKFLTADAVISRAETETEIVFANNRITETLVQNYLIATDNAYEKERGTGHYEHQIYLIELTKVMEGYIGDSMTFTNTLGNNFTESN